MKRNRYFAIFLTAGLVSLLVCLKNPLSSVAQPSLQLQTQPPLSQVIPATEPVQLTLQAIGADQQPLRDAIAQIRLLTPPKTPWLSSDFPVVEGTTLLEMVAIAPSGVVQLEQTLPIRGDYQLEVNMTPQTAGAFEPFNQVLTLSVPENPKKYRNVAILAAILLLSGLASGWVLGGDHTLQDGEIAPRPVRMLLSAAILLSIVVLLVINIGAERAEIHSDHHSGHSHTSSLPAIQQSQGIQVELSGDAGATVGQLATQTVKVTDAATQSAVTDVTVKLQVVALEHNERVLAFEGFPDNTGTLTWDQQFFDGAPHQVIATVSPISDRVRQFSPIQVAHEVAVEGIAPPLLTRLVTLMYFTAVFIAALVIGLVMRRRFGLRQNPLSC